MSITIKSLITSALLILALFSPRIQAACDPGFAKDLGTAERIAGSLRADKPGLARVYAYEGSEFTAGQVAWLKGQLREIREACAQGRPADAAEHLKAVHSLLVAHVSPVR